MKKRFNGLSLVELMVVIDLVAILASFSVNGMTGMVAKRRVKSVAQKLASEINFARFLARKTGKRVWLVTTKGEPQPWLGDEDLLYFMFVDENENNGYDNGSDTIVVKGYLKSIEFDNNTLGKDCSTVFSNARCLTFFPVGVPLIGNQDPGVKVKHSSRNICYLVKVYRNIGLAETEACD